MSTVYISFLRRLVAAALVSGAALAASAGPAHAASRSAADFGETVAPATRAAFPAARLLHSRQEILPSTAVQLSTAMFNLGPRASVLVTRQVGAVPAIAGETSLARPGAAARTARLSAAPGGLTSLSWTERKGVNFKVIARGAVPRDALLTLAKGLPADESRPPAVAPAPARIDAVAPRSTADGFVAGAGAWTDDLNDESTLSTSSSYRYSNYTGLWQMILAADGTLLPWSEIDCDFGPTTKQYTTWWQQDAGVATSNPGTVDGPTRAAAGQNFALEYTVADGSDYGYYLGYWDNIFIHRHGPNISPAYRWDVRNINNNYPDDWHGAAYTYANFRGC